MTTTQEVICDGCGADLTSTSNSVDYRICLSSQGISSGGGAVTDMYIENPLPQSKHFCGLRCLYKWADDTRGEQELRERLLSRMTEQPNLEEVVMKVWSETQHRLSEDLVEDILTAAFEFDAALNKNTEEGS